MKTCNKCFREFDNNEILDYSPTRDLGEILTLDVDDINVEDLCPECRDELGIMTLMGFVP